MGELEPWIDENFVRSVWFNMGEQVNVKMIRDKFSGYDILLTRHSDKLLRELVMPAIVLSISRAQLQQQKR